jgi:hypothetical protein
MGVRERCLISDLAESSIISESAHPGNEMLPRWTDSSSAPGFSSNATPDSACKRWVSGIIDTRLVSRPVRVSLRYERLQDTGLGNAIGMTDTGELPVPKLVG